jgi:hypothetical protein
MRGGPVIREGGFKKVWNRLVPIHWPPVCPTAAEDPRGCLHLCAWDSVSTRPGWLAGRHSVSAGCCLRPGLRPRRAPAQFTHPRLNLVHKAEMVVIADDRNVEAMVSRRSMNERTALGRRSADPQAGPADTRQVEREGDREERHRRRHQQPRLGKAPNPAPKPGRCHAGGIGNTFPPPVTRP